MNIQSFLEHHGILRNPFAEEDAQTDPVFKEHCISNAYHPIWDKVYGDPSDPSTSIIFGPKGSGKTAMRLQIDRHLARYNHENSERRVYVIHYDDFNPFLDHFSERLSRRVSKKPEKVLDAWRLWDHVDAILCIGVTDLVDRMLGINSTGKADAIDDASIRSLDRTSARDLLLLAACYDQSTDSTFMSRWNSLRKHLRYGNMSSKTTLFGAIVWSILAIIFVGWLFPPTTLAEGGRDLTALWLLPLLLVIGWLPHWIRVIKCQIAALGMHRHMRVGKRETGSMRKVLQSIPKSELASQPLPRYDRTDDRYELLHKFQGILRKLGYTGIIVLMDRVDEPHMTGGKPELMQRFVWPMLDNKLLKHPGMGFKMMLPQELHREIERETREFHERARLDKQNVIPAFQWTGEALYDLARARMMACAGDNQTPEPKDLFEDDVSYQRMLSAFQSLRVPRHLFRFLYRVLVDHCNHYTDSQPEFKIKAETFESALAVYGRDNDPTFT
ncbi:hypothetical protein [Novipirellula caenicola]|uniref:Uncharacterized protein n=1 Tax=Novipirellula caenicola TaxID=1536901 RepID=A0ABP9VVZ6_9BACT